MKKYMKFLLPFQGMELGWEARRGARTKHPPTTAHCHLPHREALKQGEGFRFWNEGQRLMVKPASFLSFSFSPSCSQELTLGGSRCLTELLYAKLCAALGPPPVLGGAEGLAQPPSADKRPTLNSKSSLARGQSHRIPPQSWPSAPLSVNVCWLAYKSRASVCLLHQGARGSQPTGREAVCVFGGRGCFHICSTQCPGEEATQVARAAPNTQGSGYPVQGTKHLPRHHQGG